MEEDAIHQFVIEHGNKNFKDNWIGVFAADEFQDYMKLLNFQKTEKLKNPIAVFNTEKRENGGEHWIALVVADDKKLIVFDSFGKKGFNKFFLTDDIKKFKKFCTFENLKPLSSNGIVDFFTFKIDIFKYHKYRTTLAKLSQSFFNYSLALHLCHDPKNPFFEIHYSFDKLQEDNTNYCGAFVLLFLQKLTQQKQIDKDTVENVLTNTFYDFTVHEKNEKIC